MVRHSKVHHIVPILCPGQSTLNVPRRKALALPTPQRSWSHIALDFVTDIPESLSNTIILVVLDQFSCSLHLIPLPVLPTAFETMELVFNHMFRYYSISDDIVSDRWVQFTSRVWFMFMEKLEVSVSFSSGYHPQSNRQVGCANQEIGRFPRMFCSEKQGDWSQFFPWVEYAQNSL